MMMGKKSREAVTVALFAITITLTAASCSNGLDGIQSTSLDVCCVEACGTCGGVGCTPANTSALTAADCCASEIVASGVFCDVSGAAPCIITTSSASDDSVCINGQPGVQDDDTDVCCPLECGDVCGGEGCGTIPGVDASQCCAAAIMSAGLICSDLVAAPCVIVSSESSSAATLAPTLPPTLAPTTAPTRAAITGAPVTETVAPVTPASPEPTSEPSSSRGLVTPSPIQVTAPTATVETEAPASTLAPGQSPALTLAPTSSSAGSSSNSTPIVAGVISAVAGAALIVLAVLGKRRRDRKQKMAAPPLVSPANDDGSLEQGPAQPRHAQLPSYAAAFALSDGDDKPPAPEDNGLAPPPPYAPGGTGGNGGGGIAPSSAPPAAQLSGQLHMSTRYAAADGAKEKPTTSTASTATGSASNTANASTAERAELAVSHQRQVADGPSVVNGRRPEDASGRGTEAPSAAERQSSAGDLGLGHAVLAAAQELARSCQVPGISEAAGVLCVMAHLFTDSRENGKESDTRLRQCRSIVLALRRAVKVVGKGGDTTGEAARALIEDVHDAIFDLVELIKTFQSKNKLSKVFLSTLFRRRQDELDAVVDRAIMRLQLGLQVQVGHDVSSVKESIRSMEDGVVAVQEGVKAVEEGMHLSRQGSIAEATSEAVAEARSIRRQRKLDQVEIPEDHLFITTDLLGKGGFGEVYLADYNGHNAAAKVLHIAHDVGALDDNQQQRETRQRKAFLRELEAMIRLRSPNTVNVFGAVTSLPDRMVLVMELLPNGDLLALLRKPNKPLPEEKSRRIIGDICAGMAFLHGKNTIHGDLKSANVLLDGSGRAKIGDFGTSRWSQHTNSTGLATYTTKANQSTQMSLAWSAPEVLESGGSTYKSDVYSFGIVVWEVLNRELPWAHKTRPRDILSAVLMGIRPSFHVDTPTDIVDIAKSCWGGEPEERTTFSALLEELKAKGWRE